jgi:hypothetical protein
MTGTVQISFHDEHLKKEVGGSFTSDGKSIHVFSEYGSKSFPYNDLGAVIDYPAQVLFKDLQKQTGPESIRPKESLSMWGSRS